MENLLKPESINVRSAEFRALTPVMMSSNQIIKTSDVQTAKDDLSERDYHLIEGHCFDVIICHHILLCHQSEIILHSRISVTSPKLQSQSIQSLQTQ